MTVVAIAGSTFTFGICLYQQADTKLLQNTPTIAAGDWQESTNGGAWANLDNLPTVTPAAGERVQIVLAAAETTAAAAGGEIMVKWEDAAGAEWCSGYAVIRVHATELDSLATATAVADVPTVAEMNARTILTADYFDPTADDVALVTLCTTTTTNSDMVGTNNAALAATALTDATWTDARAGYLDELAAANLPTDIADIPTVAEFNARTQPTADYFDPTADDVALVTLCTTTTTNSDMAGTNNAALAATALSDATWTNARAAYLDELAAANLPTDIADIPTVAEFNARTQPTADYFDPTADDVALVTLCTTTTTNSDMAGTNNAALAATALTDATWTNARAVYLDELAAGNLPTDISSLENISAADVNAEVVDALTIDIIADVVSADGTRPTIAQALLELNRFMQERGVVATTVSAYKEDGVTPAMTFTLDSAIAPTTITRAT